MTLQIDCKIEIALQQKQLYIRRDISFILIRKEIKCNQKESCRCTIAPWFRSQFLITFQFLIFPCEGNDETCQAFPLQNCKTLSFCPSVCLSVCLSITKTPQPLKSCQKPISHHANQTLCHSATMPPLSASQNLKYQLSCLSAISHMAF